VNLFSGDPRKEISKNPLKNHYDVVAMDNRGMGRLKEMFLGSVSNTVIRDTNFPFS
jgi:nucleotide-binding universal stress UspA family protein